MTLYIVKSFFVGLWPLVWHLGGATLTIIALLLFVFATPAWLLPSLKKVALWVAATLAIGMAVFVAGDKVGADRVREQWDWALQAEATHGAKIGADAERAVSAEPDSVRDHDVWNRDTWKK